MIHAFPKIFAVGSDYIQDLFAEEVEITEKVDGSQFAFGRKGKDRFMRSKGRQIYPESVDSMFRAAVEYVESIELPDGIVFYAEYLARPKHNVLAYDRIPKNHLMLFGACTFSGKFLTGYRDYAEELGLECAPILAKGVLPNMQTMLGHIDQESVLGGTLVEGVVVKNYARPFLLGGQPIPLMMGKFVSEKFKEKHQTEWKSKPNKWELFKEGYRTEARWAKAVQHLRDNGELINEPKDIGALIKEIQNDIKTEEMDSIKDGLWRMFMPELLRKATAGFPEWYKEQLLGRAFEGKEDEAGSDPGIHDTYYGET